ncbi:signal recognition particle receptor subunit beta [Prorops nasuta]|uniref:signal recognition particle receptor subunit beta n=1 Tax=Prorops nasuta TaxID=863751 RepID=UPI0034CE029B
MEKKVEQIIHKDNSQIYDILTAVFLIIITLVLFAIWRRRKAVGQSILLTGLCDAGKTLIYARLQSSKFVKTHTSVKENIGDIIINKHVLKIVDIPGHERLRYTFFNQYKLSLKGLVYVIDSVTIQKDIRDVAEYLYNLLSDPALQKNIPVLILCNKQDQAMAKGCSVIKTLLEKEINLLRLTKTNQLNATDDSSASSFLGKLGKDFEFSHIASNVELAESYGFNKDADNPADIKELNAWLQKIG